MCIYDFREDSRTIWFVHNVCATFFQVLCLSQFYQTHKHNTPTFSALHQSPSGRSWEGQGKKMVSYLGKDLPNTFTIFISPITSTWFFSFCSSKYLTRFSVSWTPAIPTRLCGSITFKCCSESRTSWGKVSKRLWCYTTWKTDLRNYVS